MSVSVSNHATQQTRKQLEIDTSQGTSFNFKILDDLPDQGVNDASEDFFSITVRSKKERIALFNFRESWAHIHFCPWFVHRAMIS